uniref:Sulfatase N-terminal domain-containing protein n=1 Tax=Syphacia muris TaxID=451379 RepID=A0A0N5ACA7_9BILA
MRLPLRYYLLKLYKSVHILLILLLITIVIAYFGGYRLTYNEIPIELLHYQVIPQLNPWDPSILKYYKKPYPLKCAVFQNNVTVLSNGRIKILDEYRDSLACRCRTFEHYDGVSDFKVSYDEWTDIDPVKGKVVAKDFVEVECHSKGILPTKKYSYHWPQILLYILKRSLMSFLNSSTDHPSVLLFGLDSMSRSNVIRALPKFHRQLQSMGFIDMTGHVKIADNTFQNWAAFLTGKRCSPTREFKGELPDEWYIFFDDWPFIWKNFSDARYATLFAEDRPDIATYNYLEKLNGFKFKPTDHYFRPYWLEIFWNFLKMRSTPFCYDAIPTHKLQLHYLKEFLKQYDGIRSFAFHWSQELSHEYMNQVGIGDDSFAQFFADIQPYISNTIIVVVSDHGHRYDAIRETIIGRLESRLPYFSIYLPENFRKKYPSIVANIQLNSKKLTTPFDIHQTLIDIANVSFTESSCIVYCVFPVYMAIII